jgi:hypothetical protein
LPDTPTRERYLCHQRPGKSAPDRGCDLPLTLDLIALDPFAPTVDLCPPPTVWAEWSCRLPNSPPVEDPLIVCLLAPPDHPACVLGWSSDSGWKHTRPGYEQLPATLDEQAIQLGVAAVEQRLRDCVPQGESARLRLSIEGPTGAVVRVEVRGEEASARCLAEVAFTARFPTFVHPAQGIERTIVAAPDQ